MDSSECSLAWTDGVSGGGDEESAMFAAPLPNLRCCADRDKKRLGGCPISPADESVTEGPFLHRTFA